ncbi:hypothetical protein HKD37_15G043426 [Glycine soja]
MTCIHFFTYSSRLVFRKNAITKRAPRHPYCTRSKSRTMGDQEEIQEQMKADMSALKEKMASMMDAMLGMRQLMENNVAIAAAVSSTAEADPTLRATAHHPLPNVAGRERSTLGHINNPHLGYNRVAYPYGLPPNYTPPVMRDDAGHVPSLILEGEPPRQSDVKLVGYMPSNFADLVFAGERIEVGLKRGKFDYVSSTGTNARRIEATRARRKEGDTHAVTLAPAWTKKPQISHGTHEYAQHHSSFSARAGDSSNSAPRETPQATAPTPTRPADNALFGAGSNTTRNFPPRPTFTPIPMTYEDLLPSLVTNQMTVISPGMIYQPPFPKWYNPDTTCAYHGKTPGHSTEQCLAFKHKVQNLIEVEWLTFQEDRPNVKTNTLANHGGGAVNAVESGRPRRSKPLKDVMTPRRFIYEALQKGGIIPCGGPEEDSYLMHPGALHNMEACLAVKNLLQQMIDQGRLEVSDEGGEEQHICIHAVLWRYAPPRERKEEATDISSLSAKVTNITGLSGVTHSGRVFAPPDLPTQPANAKGKAKIAEEQNDKVIPAPDEDIPMKGLSEKKDGCGKKEVSLEEAGEFLCIIQQSEFKVIEQLNKTPARVSFGTVHEL